MSLMRRTACMAALALGACTPPGFSEDPNATAGRDLPQPQIEPLEPILAGRPAPPADAGDPDLVARGDALRRADGGRDGPETGDLTERGAALRERADALRDGAP